MAPPPAPTLGDDDPELEFSPDRSTTILIVEDDRQVRALARRVLAGQAYRVLEAMNGSDALRVASMHEGDIDLVLTDVDMPTIGVRAMLSRLAKSYPESAVLLTSGYSDTELLGRGFDKGNDPFLAKPFSGGQLVSAVRDALGARRAPAL